MLHTTSKHMPWMTLSVFHLTPLSPRLRYAKLVLRPLPLFRLPVTCCFPPNSARYFFSNSTTSPSSRASSRMNQPPRGGRTRRRSEGSNPEVSLSARRSASQGPFLATSVLTATVLVRSSQESYCPRTRELDQVDRRVGEGHLDKERVTDRVMLHQCHVRRFLAFLKVRGGH